MVSFLHAADLHLGLRITRFSTDIAKRVREARFQALEKIRAAADEQRVDFVLIAGDLFDDHAVDGDIAKRAFDLLESFPAPAYVLSGNHDPLLAGAIWDRPPWNTPRPKKLCVLREATPVEIVPGVVLFPCPVFRKTSTADPTAWIATAPVDAGPIRIGIAHGSLKVRDDLPLDDHLIARHAAHECKLDYLALGHWHSRQHFAGPDGVERTAYPGVHEPLRFPGSSESRTGWVPYSHVRREEFLDSGHGEILHVRIDRPGAPPVLQALEVSHLVWREERYDLTSEEQMSRLIDQVAVNPLAERCLLRLRLEGILEAQAMLRLEQLRAVVDRYLFAELDDTKLRLQPGEDEIRQVAGDGVLRRVLEQLQQEASVAEPEVRRLAERTILLLYQIAHEVGA
ncbi:MAG TPA: DNA repair exonuclease [Gemmataceae bacterium]|nr:DNA repair exonuclease [Gemmataceae bacterium]